MVNYVCAIVKDKHKNIREWAEHNRSIGFDKIVLYDNNSSAPYDDQLGDLIKCGFIEIRSWKDTRWSRQIRAYNDFVISGKWQDSDWCAFIEVGEFILFDDNKTVSEITALYDRYSCLELKITTYNINASWQNATNITHICKFKNNSSMIKFITRLRDIEYIPSPYYFIFKNGGICKP